MVLLLGAEALTIVGSWLCSVMMPELDITSLLSESGIRWFIGHFSDMMSCKLLVDILLMSMAYGMVRESGVVPALRSLFRGGGKEGYTERIAIHIAVLVAILMVIVICMMTFLPQAILLSATGHIADSSLMSGLIPILSFILILSSGTYAMVSMRFQSTESLLKAMSNGIHTIAPFLVLYILIAQLYFSIVYVMPDLI